MIIEIFLPREVSRTEGAHKGLGPSLRRRLTNNGGPSSRGPIDGSQRGPGGSVGEGRGGFGTGSVDDELGSVVAEVDLQQCLLQE